MENYIFLSSWHAAWLIIIATLCLAVRYIFKFKSNPKLNYVAILTVSQFMVIAFIFLFTDAARHLRELTTLNRITLFFMPLMFFCSMIFFEHIVVTETRTDNAFGAKVHH